MVKDEPYAITAVGHNVITRVVTGDAYISVVNFQIRKENNGM